VESSSPIVDAMLIMARMTSAGLERILCVEKVMDWSTSLIFGLPNMPCSATATRKSKPSSRTCVHCVSDMVMASPRQKLALLISSPTGQKALAQRQSRSLWSRFKYS
jgi:hypothetical protein